MKALSPFVCDHIRQRFPEIQKIEYRRERGRYCLTLPFLLLYVREGEETIATGQSVRTKVEFFLKYYFHIHNVSIRQHPVVVWNNSSCPEGYDEEEGWDEVDIWGRLSWEKDDVVDVRGRRFEL